MFPDLEEIKRRRKRLGLSQKELAEIVGISQSAIAKIETGKMVPNYNLARKIFETLEKFEKTGEKKARDVMSSPAVCVKVHEKLEKAAKIIVERGFSYVPVIDDNGRMVGGINERVLLDAGKESYQKPCRDFMLLPFISVSGDVALSTVKAILKREPIVVVVDRCGKVKGVITRSDIIL